MLVLRASLCLMWGRSNTWLIEQVEKEKKMEKLQIVDYNFPWRYSNREEFALNRKKIIRGYEKE